MSLLGIALTMVVGQVAIFGALAWFVHRFGQYTAATLKAHESNMLVYQQAVKILAHAETILREDKSA